jgi:ABC-type Mn2+/Zn2+ transport system ATPase subunit
MLDAHVVVTKGTFTLDARVACGADELVVVVGPNGAGKTTLLRAIAGLERLDAGHVVLDREDVTDAPPYDRRVGFVPQDDALLPRSPADSADESRSHVPSQPSRASCCSTNRSRASTCRSVATSAPTAPASRRSS